jgi:Uri superfamily endonuclease
MNGEGILKGSYALFMHLKEEDEIRIGSLGKIELPKGYYVYVGSAMNGIEGRVNRHLRNRKKVHWHIDYFLKKVEISSVYYLESKKRTECKIANKFSREFEGVPKFGSSDCQCEGHLFYGKRKELVNCAKENEMKILF